MLRKSQLLPTTPSPFNTITSCTEDVVRVNSSSRGKWQAHKTLIHAVRWSYSTGSECSQIWAAPLQHCDDSLWTYMAAGTTTIWICGCLTCRDTACRHPLFCVGHAAAGCCKQLLHGPAHATAGFVHSYIHNIWMYTLYVRMYTCMCGIGPSFFFLLL